MTNGETVALEYIGTAVGSIVLLLFMALVALTAFGMADLTVFGASITIALAFLVSMSAVQVFGIDVLKALKSYRERE